MNEGIEPLFPKYFDYFGRPPTWVYETLSTDVFSIRNDPDKHDYNHKMRIASELYFFNPEYTIEDSLKAVKLEDSRGNQLNMARILKEDLFGHHAWHHFIRNKNKEITPYTETRKFQKYD